MAERVEFRVGTEFESYNQFKERLNLYEQQEKCNFSVGSSLGLKKVGNVTDQDIQNIHYKRAHFICKFSGKPRNVVEINERKRDTTSYKQECPSYFKVSMRKRNGLKFLRITHLNETHENHQRDEDLFETMPKQRRMSIEANQPFLKQVVQVKPNFQMLQSNLSSGKRKVKKSDLYNYKIKIQTEKGLVANVDENDFDKMVKEMLSVNGAAVKVCRNEQNELEGILFQDGRMKKIFDTFPDLLMFDATYSLNDRRMPLVILLVVDGNGESQVAGFFLVKSENTRVLNFLFERFKEENPKHTDVAVVITDKHISNRIVVETQFPTAVHHLCIFHVEKIFHEEITPKKRNINAQQKKACIRILTDMIYANDQERYDTLYAELNDTNCRGKYCLLSTNVLSFNLIVCFG